MNRVLYYDHRRNLAELRNCLLDQYDLFLLSAFQFVIFLAQDHAHVLLPRANKPVEIRKKIEKSFHLQKKLPETWIVDVILFQ
jgi:hypothetical protein